jgi:hypothetical protein
VDEVMIVLGTDTHKRSHTVAAINAATGQSAKRDRATASGARRAIDSAARDSAVGAKSNA